MADKTSRLAEIYKSEKARGGGLASTLGKRALEKIDPRQMFNQKGLLAAALPSIFKTYKATPSEKIKDLSSLQTPSLGNVDGLISEMRDVKLNSRISAKNSMSLPSMARDMNVMRQNIGKLVKLQGGTPREGADMYFKKASENEAAYESQYTREKNKPRASTTPTQQAPKKEEGGLLGGLLTLLGSIGSSFSNLLSVLPGLSTAISVASSALSALGSALGLLASPAGVIFGLMGAMGLAIKYFSDKLIDNEKKLGGDKGAEMMSQQVADVALGAGDAMGGGTSFVTGEDVTGRKLGTPEDILENRKAFTEEQKKQQSAETLKRLNITPSSAGGGRGRQGGPTAEQLNPTPPTSPTQIPSSEGEMDPGKKQILDFIASKESASAGYNALVYGRPGSDVPKSAPLTDMTIQEVFDYQKGMIAKGHASTAVGRYQFLNATLKDLVSKSNISLNEKFTPETQDKLAGMLLDQAGYSKFKSGKISQDTFQNRVAGIWASLPKVDGTSDYAGIAGNKVGATSSAFKTVLASASQIPPTPSTGAALVTTSTQVASASGQGGPVVVNNTTNNTMASAGDKTQRASNIPSAYDDVFTALLARVA